MYSDDDLEAVIAAGVVDRQSIERMRDFLARSSRTSAVDEEHFRLITGFNDIFVSIACVLLLVALGWIGQAIPIGLQNGPRPLGGLFVAAASWGLAEMFTARRRMALPSILLLLGFVGGLFALTGSALAAMLDNVDAERLDRTIGTLVIAGSALVAGGGAWLHWRRFHVPITVAAGAGSGVAVLLALIVSIVPDLQDRLAVPAFIGGLAVFGLAMRWDMSDPKRETRRADVAFWLHLLAAPLIVHPVFAMMGLLQGGVGLGGASVVVALYIAMGLVALAIDRRALMVSALAYVLYALSELFREFGAVSLNIALTALVLGSALLMLSAYWPNVRAAVLAALPEGLRARLPEAHHPDPTLAHPA
ncbi:hypothetical protein HZF05_18790 [Sphingomonas sp. CGMCC 1.13654]|uniref:DUF2157 domain-containing protein n=1 Tax=Sphingomonas chungangi TaxID=2683589 RepID=A0A838LAC1_9SPHN|nr:hypothetical protein [Sphingomonas chungangi]MBA2936134.1 hypothetical protein [Sphingomonas chungangi]MVW55520.1 hypothetical protein [Sphingomonas chungangi]